VTTAAALAGPVPSLARLLAGAIRPEFRVDVLLAKVNDPVLGAPPCSVLGCSRPWTVNKMCAAHNSRWRAAGLPDLAAWLLQADPAVQGQRALRPCRAPGCGRGRKQNQLCHQHAARWRRAGRPAMEPWLAGGTGTPLALRGLCRVRGCGLQEESTAELCTSHVVRWRNHGKPPVEQFLDDCALFGQPKYDLRRLPAQLRAEMQYALQRRSDAQRTRTPPEAVDDLLRVLITSGEQSLLDQPPEHWIGQLERAGYRKHVARRLLTDAVGYLQDLLEGTGWDNEYPRDIWLLHRLGYPTRDSALHFDPIEPRWLRELAKRWTRWRLSTGITPSGARADLKALTELAIHHPQLRDGPQTLTRPLLEAHLAWLAQTYPHPKTRTMAISKLSTFLRTISQLQWHPQLNPDAQIYREDYPRQDAPAPRGLSEHVMAQLESPAALERFAYPASRLLAEILMRTGLRVTDGCQLPLDCLRQDPQGAPYLHYRNHKMRRDALVPIDDALAESVREQQAATRERFAEPVHLLPRQNRNPHGALALARATFVGQLQRWLRDCQVRDELGRPARVTPHQWRQTYATRLINSDVPQEVVRRLLDHTSHQMTARYAQLSDRTIRDSWERARKVDIRGQEIPYDPASPLADAVWMTENLGRARMALPNGYCGLPLQQSCPHANACVTCPLFLTTPQFLPQHHEHLAATRRLIATAEADGQFRLVEMNQQVADNLEHIIDGLQPTPTEAPTPCWLTTPITWLRLRHAGATRRCSGPKRCWNGPNAPMNR